MNENYSMCQFGDYIVSLMFELHSDLRLSDVRSYLDNECFLSPEEEEELIRYISEEYAEYVADEEMEG